MNMTNVTNVTHDTRIYYAKERIAWQLDKMQEMELAGKQNTDAYKHECCLLAGYAEMAWIMGAITESESEKYTDIADDANVELIF